MCFSFTDSYKQSCPSCSYPLDHLCPRGCTIISKSHYAPPATCTSSTNHDPANNKDSSSNKTLEHCSSIVDPSRSAADGSGENSNKTLEHCSSIVDPSRSAVDGSGENISSCEVCVVSGSGEIMGHSGDIREETGMEENKHAEDWVIQCEDVADADDEDGQQIRLEMDTQLQDDDVCEHVEGSGQKLGDVKHNGQVNGVMEKTDADGSQPPVAEAEGDVSCTIRDASSHIAACCWCNMSFRTIVALKKHLIVHASVTWQRQHCDVLSNTSNIEQKLTQSSKNFEKETSRSHEDSKFNHCDHQRKTLTWQSLKQANTIVPSPVIEMDHDVAGKVSKCLQCGFHGKTHVALTFHLQNTHIKTDCYMCLKCGKTFSSLRSLTTHMQTHPAKSGHEKDPTSHPYQCGLCASRFMHVGKLASHAERHTQPTHFWCSLCGQGYRSITELTGHQCQWLDKQSESLHSWDYPGYSTCAKVTDIEGEHEKRESPIQGDSSQSVSGALQKQSNNGTQQELVQVNITGRASMERKAKNLVEKPSKRGRKKKPQLLKEEYKPFNCPDCPTAFLHASALKRHSQKHTGQDAFPCPKCPLTFPSRKQQQLHQERDHWGSTPITCHVCGKVFRKVRNLEEHLVLHTEEKPYACQTCGERFQYRQALCRHRRSHKASFFKCQECGVEFHLQSQYKLHLIKHLAILPHLCSVCGAAFPSPYLLKKHAVTHGQKQFVCEHCGKAFHHKFGHKMHVRTHLEVKPFPCSLCDKSFVSGGKLKLHYSVVHQGIKPHQCDQCDARFAHASALQDHVTGTHTHEKPFPCSMCSLRFHSKKYRSVHFLRHHKKCKTWGVCTAAPRAPPRWPSGWGVRLKSRRSWVPILFSPGFVQGRVIPVI